MNQISTFIFWESNPQDTQQEALMIARRKARTFTREGCIECPAQMRRFTVERRCLGALIVGEAGKATILVTASFPKERTESCRLEKRILRTKEG